MGLLDLFDNGDAQLGLGLLAAAAPRVDNAGFGQRLMEGINSAQGMRNAQMQRQLQALQMAQAQQKFEMLKGAMSDLSKPQGYAPQVMDNGQAPGIGQLGSGTFGVLPTSQGADPVPQTRQAPTSNGIAGWSPDRIAMFKMATGEDLSPIWKTAKEGFERKPGSFYDSVDGRRTYIGDPTKGVTYDNGVVGLMPGALDTQAALARIPEAAKDAFGFTTVPDGSGGTQTLPNPVARARLSAPVQPQAGDGSPSWAGPMPSASAIAALTAKAQSNDPEAADARQALSLIQAKMGSTSPIVNQNPPRWGYTPPASQLEADKATALAGVNQTTKPQLDYSTNAATAFQKYGENLNGRLAESQALLQRIEQSKNALERFKSGGGTEARTNIAQAVQAFGAPPALVDKIAGGDLSAVQEFQKYAAQEALQTMRQALASETGMASSPGNRVAMQVFFKNNPNIDTDKRAIEKIFNFQTSLHNDLLKESDLYTNYITDPTKPKDPAVFMNDWAHRQIQSGRVNPSKTSTVQPSAAPSGNQKSAPIPLKGMIQDGYKFMGGDPSNPANWSKM